jgi:hypothetical protein
MEEKREGRVALAVLIFLVTGSIFAALVAFFIPGC